MDKLKLSKRLNSVANYIPKGSVVADIGSDHAYLPIFAMQNDIAIKAIAGEVVQGPFEAAKSSVLEAGLQHLIEVRKGDGLEVITGIDAVNCITIAGMGGGLIVSILENGKDKLKNVSRLILQPNIAANLVREWLVNNEWELIEENILEEDGHIYEILVAERGESKRPYQNIDKEQLFGPFLLKAKNDIFQNKWQREYIEWVRIFEQLEKANDNEQIRRKKDQLKQYIDWYKEEFGNETTERT